MSFSDGPRGLSLYLLLGYHQVLGFLEVCQFKLMTYSMETIGNLSGRFFFSFQSKHCILNSLSKCSVIRETTVPHEPVCSCPISHSFSEKIKVRLQYTELENKRKEITASIFSLHSHKVTSFVVGMA